MVAENEHIDGVRDRVPSTEATVPWMLRVVMGTTKKAITMRRAFNMRLPPADCNEIE